MFLDIIHRHVFCLKIRPVYILKHNVSETGFYLRPQVKPTLSIGLNRTAAHVQVYSQFGKINFDKFNFFTKTPIQLKFNSMFLHV
jgi:hypothetical protein